MTSNSKYHKNYTEFGEPYQLVLPLNLEGLVPDDDSVRLLSHELEELDYSLLYFFPLHFLPTNILDSPSIIIAARR